MWELSGEAGARIRVALYWQRRRPGTDCSRFNVIETVTFKRCLAYISDVLISRHAGLHVTSPCSCALQVDRKHVPAAAPWWSKVFPERQGADSSVIGRHSRKSCEMWQKCELNERWKSVGDATVCSVNQQAISSSSVIRHLVYNTLWLKNLSLFVGSNFATRSPILILLVFKMASRFFSYWSHLIVIACQQKKTKYIRTRPQSLRETLDGCSGGACFPPMWCELLGRPLRDVRVDHFSYPTPTCSR